MRENGQRVQNGRWARFIVRLLCVCVCVCVRGDATPAMLCARMRALDETLGFSLITNYSRQSLCPCVVYCVTRTARGAAHDTIIISSTSARTLVATFPVLCVWVYFVYGATTTTDERQPPQCLCTRNDSFIFGSVY